MSSADRPLDMAALRRLHELIGRVNGCRSLSETLQAVVDSVVEVVGFQVAVVNYVHTDGSFEVVAVAGDSRARAELLGTRAAADAFEQEFVLADKWGSLRFVPHDRLENGVGPGWVPDLEVIDAPDAWHPMDALFAPLRSPAGELVGMLSVDLPNDRRRPGQFQRELLQMFAAQAGIAVDNARLTERLQTSEEAFRLAFEGAGNGMAVLSLSSTDPGRFLRVNPALCRIVGYSAEELLLRRYFDITHPDDRQRDLDAMYRAIDGAVKGVYQTEKRYLHASGTIVWVSVTTSVVLDPDGTAQYAISQVEDITLERAARDDLAHRASHDVLTGLPNRRTLQERLETAVRTARVRQRPGAVLFCDLDGFKDVNDRHGHAAGDRVLVVIAQRLAAASRSGDTVARLGGDEFVVVADDVSRDEAADLAGRFSQVVAAPLVFGDLSARVTASIGIAVIDGGEDDAGQLLQAADAAMYRAKVAGKDTHSFHHIA